MSYQQTADILVDRIVTLIPEHPKIMDMKSPWDLFRVNGFKCDDIGPSLAQARWALMAARKQYAASRA